MLHESLWSLNADLAADCLRRPFVHALGTGTLDIDAFRRYVAQDAFFLRAFANAYAIALAKSATLEQAAIFHDLIGGVLDELKLHAGYAAKLQVDLSNLQPYRETTAYTDFLLAKAWHGNLSEILAAMVPCMKLYAHIGSSLRPLLRTGHPYEDWIRTYSGKDFGELCTMLERLLDATASDTSSVREAYRYAMRCELDFFAAPLKQAD